MRTLKLIFLGCGFLIFSVLSASAALQETLPSGGSAMSLAAQIRQASELQKKGEYIEAQKIYEAALHQPGLQKKQRTKIRKKYEALNIKILFSRYLTPESEYYKVQPGDNLYDLSNKYKTTVALIKKSNGLKNDTIMAGANLKVMTGTFAIRVSKAKNVLTLLLNDKPFKHYRVATGANGGTPEGKFKITSKVENPIWYKSGAIVPAGSPENFLGTRWLGFDFPGYGIHGTVEPETIGKQATSGCVRMLNQEVEELYTIVPIGTMVTVAD